jgi:hypothetical protein
MSDQEIVKKAYEDQIAGLYKVFVAAFTSAQGDPAGEKQAKDRFQAGVKHARHTRDLALGLIP